MNNKLIKSLAIMLVVLIFLTACGNQKANKGKNPIKKPQQGITSSDNSASDIRDTDSDGDGDNEENNGYDSDGDFNHSSDNKADTEAIIDYSSYPIIYPAGLNEAAQYSVNRLAAKLNAKYAMIDVFDDTYKSKPGQKELLIGNTNRSESKKAYNMLLSNRSNNAADYIIMVNNGSIVINATSNYALEKATKYFFDKLCVNEFAEIKENYSRFYKAPLIARSGQIAGTDIGKYKIVMPRDKSFIYSSKAESLADGICEAIGIEIPITDDRSSEQKYEILIGRTARTASNIKVDAGKYILRETNGKIIALGDSDISTASAVEELAARLIGKTKVNKAAGLNINKSYSKSGKDYNLTWSDEFDGTALDTKKWFRHTEEATAYDGGILYRDDSELNSYVENGRLVIKGTRSGINYRSAKLSTSNSMNFQYGYFEIRARLPKGKGMWPGFWTQTPFFKAFAEIDIMEMFGESDTIHSTVHRWWMVDAGNGHEQINSYIPSQRSYALKNGELFNDSYHTIGCEWTEEYLAFYLDGFKYTEVDITVENMDVFHQPAFLIISMAVGLTGIEKPDENTPWPGLYEIDYCRVYQKPGIGSMNIK